jgi:hypothetical protein
MKRSLTRLASLAALALAGMASAGSALADPIDILFLGNSYTFGRVDPVMSYNAANVNDLTGPMYNDPTNPNAQNGANPYEPHPWGGVAGIFKKMTDESGLDYKVSISARNAATLRGHYLNTSPAGWDLLGNVASQKWDAVVLQDQSDEPLPAGKGANANLALFNFYANKLEDYIHQGIKPGQDLATDKLATTEGQLFGGPATGTAAQRAAACIAATGGAANPNSLSQTACNTARTINGNPNENADAKVYLYETWARPNMVTGAFTTVTDAVTGAITTTTTPATAYYNTLEAMTADLHNAYYGLDAANPDYAGVAPVGDAFMLAVQMGLATRNPYAANAQSDGLIDLWWDDNLHASKYGSYLSALTLYGSITGRDPNSLGAGELAAIDLGISAADALALQRVASLQLGFDVAAVPEPSTLVLTALGLGIVGWRRRRAQA